MANISITRISGLILIQQTPSTYPKYFSGAAFVFQPSNDYTTISLTATEANGISFTYTGTYTEFLIGSQGVPPSMAMAIAWLTDILRP